MTPGAAGIFAALFAIGLVLAGNVRTAADITGNYLIGRRRMPWQLPRRRERYMRAFGTLLCGFTAAGIYRALAGASAPDWATFLVSTVGFVIPVAVWYLTRATRGAEIGDDEDTKSLF